MKERGRDRETERGRQRERQRGRDRQTDKDVRCKNRRSKEQHSTTLNMLDRDRIKSVTMNNILQQLTTDHYCQRKRTRTDNHKPTNKQKG